jgi:phosphoribosylanthranilate isomerase
VSAPFPGGLVQVAGVIDEAEARMLLTAGVDLLGFPFRLPVHREDLPEEQAARLIRRLGIGPRAVLITYLEDPGGILELARKLGCGWVQVHGEPPADCGRALRALAPGLRLVKSLVHGLEEESALRRRMAAWEPWVDAFLTDSADPRTGARGATGRIHDWGADARLSAAGTRPLWLAGGLTPQNVAAAIAAVRPAGVDAHTGLEGSDGRKDPARVLAFVTAARAAFAAHGMETGPPAGKGEDR